MAQSQASAQFLSTLSTFAFPVIGNLSVAAIDTGLVLKVLEQKVDAERGYPAGPLWQARPETASRLRGRIELVLGWATVRGYRQGDNPARWRGHLSEALPARSANGKVEHHAALPYAELPAFMAELRKREGVAAQALEFTILTAASTGEVIGARWDEIDQADVWTVPAGRMKAGKEHRVPLSSARRRAAQGSLPRRRQRLRVHRLPGRLRVVQHGDDHGAPAHGARQHHGARIPIDRSAIGRRSAPTFPTTWSSMALAHTISDKVEAAYRRGDLFEKRCPLDGGVGEVLRSASVS